MKPVPFNRVGQWTPFTSFHFTPTGRKKELHVQNDLNFCNNFRQQEDKDMRPEFINRRVQWTP